MSTVVAALVTVLWGYAVLIGFGNPRDVEISALILARTSPGLPDLVVALVAGSAGAYVQVRREEAGFLPGVAIGVSLVPPLAAAGMLLYFGAPGLAGEAALLFATNLAAIVLSACAVFYTLGMRPAERAPGATARMTLGTIVAIVAVLVIAIHLAQRTTSLLQEAHEEQRITQLLRQWAGEHRVDIEKVDMSGDRVKIVVLFGVPVFRTSELAPLA